MTEAFFLKGAFKSSRNWGKSESNLLDEALKNNFENISSKFGVEEEETFWDFKGFQNGFKRFSEAFPKYTQISKDLEAVWLEILSFAKDLFF